MATNYIAPQKWNDAKNDGRWGKDDGKGQIDIYGTGAEYQHRDAVEPVAQVGGGTPAMQPDVPKKPEEATPRLTRAAFIKKYALGPNGTFLADDKGGNSASEVAGQNVADYYDTYLGPNAKATTTVVDWSDGGGPKEMPINWGNGYDKKTGKHIDLDAWSNVDPHPESYRGTGLEEAWKVIRPLATVALVAGGIGAIGGWAAAAPAAAAPAGAASGLAGALGMNAGLAASAVNAGALNTAVSLAQGNNIGDALKSGVTAAAMSPVAGWAKGAIGGATAGLGQGVSSAIASVGSGALTGAAGAALTGRDVGKGAMTGALSGVASEVGRYAGDAAQGATGSAWAGKAANALAKSAVKGGNLKGAAGSLLASYAGEQAKDATGSDMVAGVTADAVNSAVTGKKMNLLASMAGGALDDFTNPISTPYQVFGWGKRA